MYDVHMYDVHIKPKWSVGPTCQLLVMQLALTKGLLCVEHVSAMYSYKEGLWRWQQPYSCL
jgi:hypothetical protein